MKYIVSDTKINKIFFFYIFLYFFSIIYWFFFFKYGPSSYYHLDWYKENIYLNIYRLSIEKIVLPFFYYPSIFDGNYKFLANPEISSLPDLLLLKYLTNSEYFFLHTLLFYSFGFFGIIKLGRKLNWFSFLFLWLLFTFNGFVINRFFVGHFQYGIGFFLLPIFFLIISKFENYDLKSFNFSNFKNFFYNYKIKYPIIMSFLLSFLYFNGSFHFANWLCLYLLFIIFFNTKFLLNVICTFLFTFLISFGKIIPAIFFFRPLTSFLTGYPNIPVLLQSLLEHRPQFRISIYNKGEWGPLEFEFYIGLITLVLIILALLNLRYLRKTNKIFDKIFIYPSLCLLFLSMGNMFDILGIFSSIERIVTRFIVVPIFIFVLLSAYYINYLSNLRSSMNLRFIYLMFPFIFIDFLKYSQFFNLIKGNSTNFDDKIVRKIISYDEATVLDKLSKSELFYKVQNKFYSIFDFNISTDLLNKIIFEMNFDYNLLYMYIVVISWIISVFSFIALFIKFINLIKSKK
jgi:hypothetical protein